MSAPEISERYSSRQHAMRMAGARLMLARTMRMPANRNVGSARNRQYSHARRTAERECLRAPFSLAMSYAFIQAAESGPASFRQRLHSPYFSMRRYSAARL